MKPQGRRNKQRFYRDSPSLTKLSLPPKLRGVDESQLPGRASAVKRPSGCRVVQPPPTRRNQQKSLMKQRPTSPHHHLREEVSDLANSRYPLTKSPMLTGKCDASDWQDSTFQSPDDQLV
ncbi:uncharacterized protein LOC115321238 isoform X1 [Ixodes scapularis]|uniref:uncharacterized protein LOC115321238 isoform X1 n=1 Tax=Ixodes scapularis TaxID=6945 RepID=UPI001C385DDE|nr:uncharacterized protein LOC115321238 isoform X1 [Ixodes scapularis]